MSGALWVAATGEILLDAEAEAAEALTFGGPALASVAYAGGAAGVVFLGGPKSAPSAKSAEARPVVATQPAKTSPPSPRQAPAASWGQRPLF